MNRIDVSMVYTHLVNSLVLAMLIVTVIAWFYTIWTDLMGSRGRK